MNIPNHETREYTGVVLERMLHLLPGGKMGDLPEHLQHESFVRKGAKKTGGPNMRLLRLEDDKPSLTITAYIFNKFVHSNENRYITPREAAVLQDFPIDYEFKGTLSQVQKQIGNAVPVKLATAIALAVAKYFKRLNKGGVLKIASYFTGAGGLDLGFEAASNHLLKFKTVFSTDVEQWAEATINHNRPEWNFCRADITKLEPKMVKKIFHRLHYRNHQYPLIKALILLHLTRLLCILDIDLVTLYFGIEFSVNQFLYHRKDNKVNLLRQTVVKTSELPQWYYQLTRPSTFRTRNQSYLQAKVGG